MMQEHGEKDALTRVPASGSHVGAASRFVIAAVFAIEAAFGVWSAWPRTALYQVALVGCGMAVVSGFAWCWLWGYEAGEDTMLDLIITRARQARSVGDGSAVASRDGAS